MSLYRHPRVDSMFDAKSCHRVFALSCSTSRTFDCDPHHLIVCVVIDLREPERGFRNPCLRDLAPLARNACRRIALPSLCSLGPLVIEHRFHDFRWVSRVLPAMEWIPMHGCDPAYRFRAPLGHPAICTPLPRQRPRSSEWLDRLSFTISREEFDPRYVRPTIATDTADTRTHASYGYRMRRGFPRASDASRVFTTRNTLPRLDSFHPAALSSEGEAMFSAGSTTHGRVVPSSPLLTFLSPPFRTNDPLRNVRRSSSAKIDSTAHS